MNQSSADSRGTKRTTCNVGGGAAADLGMFSMFGRTGPHKKGAPQKDKDFFFIFATWQQARNIEIMIGE